MVNIPTHPGEMLREEFLKPLEISQSTLAKDLHLPFQRINELINGKRSMTPSTALRLSKYFGTSSELWMNLQQRWDLYRAFDSERAVLDSIIPVQVSQ